MQATVAEKSGEGCAHRDGGAYFPTFESPVSRTCRGRSPPQTRCLRCRWEQASAAVSTENVPRTRRTCPRACRRAAPAASSPAIGGTQRPAACPFPRPLRPGTRCSVADALRDAPRPLKRQFHRRPAALRPHCRVLAPRPPRRRCPAGAGVGTKRVWGVLRGTVMRAAATAPPAHKRCGLGACVRLGSLSRAGTDQTRIPQSEDRIAPG